MEKGIPKTQGGSFPIRITHCVIHIIRIWKVFKSQKQQQNNLDGSAPLLVVNDVDLPL